MGLDRCGCLDLRFHPIPCPYLATSGQLCRTARSWLSTYASATQTETGNIDEVLKQGPIFVKQRAQNVVGRTLAHTVAMMYLASQQQMIGKVLCSMVLTLQKHGEGARKMLH